jgi:hypothetical protein
MAFTKSADGIAKKGKTAVQMFPNDGQNKGTQKGGKKKAGVSSESMKAVGRNMARANYQRGG